MYDPPHAMSALSRSIVLINPNVTLQKDDMMTTGIVYMPFGLAYFASSLKTAGMNVQVIDAFAERPNQWWAEDNMIFRGLTPEEVAGRIPADAQTVVVYAINLASHLSILDIIRQTKNRLPSVPVVAMENTQAVTAYSLRQVQDDFYDAGTDYILTGEPEIRGVRLVRILGGERRDNEAAAIDGIGFQKEGTTHYSPPLQKIENLDSLPFPAWELFPLQQYWKLRYGHGPVSSGQYLPLLTSRGCPYPCSFCVIPETNDRKWRSRSARNVVDEMEYMVNRFQVREFHWEDVDPTINDQRIRDICRGLIERGLEVRWKLCSGTKVETIRDEETVEIMAKAGCRYISISPESGSEKILKLIGKPFDLEHARKLVGAMSREGIRSQTCFVLGIPGENDKDRRRTRTLVRQLSRLGADEIAVFIITPVPGSALFGKIWGYDHYAQLTFSPSWRQDYALLNRFRLRLYADFLLAKLRHHPLRLLRQPLHFLSRTFQTKMEMTPYRALHALFMRAGLAGCRVWRPNTQRASHQGPRGTRDAVHPV